MAIDLNKKLKSLTESTTIRLNAEAKALEKQGKRIYNLTVGELDFDTPLPLRHFVAQNLKRNKYTPTLGLPELRVMIARAVTRQYRLPYSAENIAVTAGAKQALSNVFQILCNPRDEVIIPTPSWVSYEHQVTLAGGKPVFVALDEHFDLDVPAIARAITERTKAIILNSPHNPTGAIFSSTKLRSLATLLKKKDIFVIADDIYSALLYTKNYRPISSFFKSMDRLVIINGFSKSHALTGWRIGYMAAGKEIIDANNRLQSHVTGNVAVPSQIAALASYRSSITPRFVKILSRRRKLVETMLSAIPKISFVSPQGAFYFFIDIRQIEPDSVRFSEKLLIEKRVAVVPGDAFHAPGFIRLSFACDETVLREALTRLRLFIAHYP